MDQTRLNLFEVINRFIVADSKTAFLCATEDDNNELLRSLLEYYKEKKIQVGLDSLELFDNLAVVDNIYIETIQARGKRRKEQISFCEQLFKQIGFKVHPMDTMAELTEEEKRIVMVCRVYVQNYKIVIFNNTLTYLGYRHFDVFTGLVKLFQLKSRSIVLLTTHWTDAVKFSDYVAVRTHNNIFTMISSEEGLHNPQRIFLALAGEGGNAPKVDGKYGKLTNILQSTDNLVGNQEFVDALRFLSVSISEAMESVECVIYLQDDDRIYTYYDKTRWNAPSVLKDDVVSSAIFSRDDTFVLTTQKADYNELFQYKSSNIQFVLGVPIVVAPMKIGLVTIMYDHYFVYTEEQIELMRTLSHEVARIVEASKLINHSILLQESYHRIKNNLQIVISLIYMQKYALKEQLEMRDTDMEILSSLDSLVARIKSIAFVHEFMAGNTSGGESINLAYIAERIASVYRNNKIRITIESEKIYVMCNRAISIAMILNELVCNSCRYAFLDDKGSCIIVINIQNNKNSIVLSVCDNGRGIDEPESFLQGKGIGVTIIRNLLREWKAECKVEVNHGTKISISIPNSISAKDFLKR